MSRLRKRLDRCEQSRIGRSHLERNAMAKYDSYVICTSPRSGSTLLCKLLAATGVAGNPDSWFHRPSISDWLADLGLARKLSVPERAVLGAIFRAAIAKGSLETGIFGLRLQRHSFDFFIEKLAVLHPRRSNDVERFQAAFGRTLFVHLTRRDKVAQAVSYVKALQTGLWHMAPDGTELERLSPPQEPAYDASEIWNRLEEVTAHDHGWERWFAASEIDPLRIAYEELSEAPIESLRAMLDHLGPEREAADGVEPGVAKLADSISRDWAARFRSEQKFT
jgi:trehalose 2-sulfotransferase